MGQICLNIYFFVLFLCSLLHHPAIRISFLLYIFFLEVTWEQDPKWCRVWPGAEKKEGEPVVFVLMPPICPLAIIL